MGFTLLALLTGAIILPGILATFMLFGAAKTREVDLPVPPLNSAEGVALVGGFSLASHAVYSIGLWIVSLLPPLIPLPLANPYQFLGGQTGLLQTPEQNVILFFGFGLVCLVALAIGKIFGRIAMNQGDGNYFYGPLAEILDRGEGPERFVTAYVLTKLQKDERIIGYQGVVAALSRDADRFPSAVLLRQASTFYLDMTEHGPHRQEIERDIDWIALSAAEWSNIAFRVYELSD